MIETCPVTDVARLLHALPEDVCLGEGDPVTLCAQAPPWGWLVLTDVTRPTATIAAVGAQGWGLFADLSVRVSDALGAEVYVFRKALLGGGPAWQSRAHYERAQALQRQWKWRA